MFKATGLYELGLVLAMTREKGETHGKALSHAA